MKLPEDIESILQNEPRVDHEALHAQRMKEAGRQDIRRVLKCLGIPVALLVAAVATDSGVDEIDKYGIVQNTRDKAELVAKGTCEVDSFGPRDRLKIPGRQRVEYECKNSDSSRLAQILGLSEQKIICKYDRSSNDYTCRRSKFSERMSKIKLRLFKLHK